MKKSKIRSLIFRLRDRLLPRHKGVDSYHHINNMLKKNEPMMLARFGAVEIKALCYVILPFPISWLFRKYTYINMPRNAGFFPASKENFRRFADLMCTDMESVDILASWRIEEILFQRRLSKCFKVGLADLNPHPEQSDFWTSALAGKRVLVIHPFAKSIERQYRENRAKLFQKENFLPKFKSLETIQAVQTIAGNHAGFDSWFDALDYMKREVEKRDFDVALIGCGAYGFPLAAHVKRLGKQALHLGGVLQLYFGIKGKRWDNKGFYNEYWTSPSQEEKPVNADKVENGCYW